MTRSSFPLTDFLIALSKASRADLARTDPDAAARKYGVRPQDAAGYIAMGMGR